MIFGGGMILFWLLLAVVVVAATGHTDRLMTWLRRPASPNSQPSNTQDTPMEILRRRYARGDMSREEFLDARRTIEGDRQS